MSKIIVNPDAMTVKEIRQKIKDNDGYCPCKFEKTDENKCPCREFLDGEELGQCHCGLYVKIEP